MMFDRIKSGTKDAKKTHHIKDLEALMRYCNRTVIKVWFKLPEISTHLSLEVCTNASIGIKNSLLHEVDLFYSEYHAIFYAHYLIINGRFVASREARPKLKFWLQQKLWMLQSMYAHFYQIFSTTSSQR